jgi:osmotically-inducible protein OsmY
MDVSRLFPPVPTNGLKPSAAGEEKPMEDLCWRTACDWSADDRDDYPVPETLAEAERLAASIERAVRHETRGGVRNLSVEVNRSGVLLKGRCTTYYLKQLAQHAAMGMPGGDRLTNQIEVS